MRGRFPSDVALRPDDLVVLERVFAQVIPEHDTHPDELAMLLLRLFQDVIKAGSVCLNSFVRLAKWISASIMPPPSSVPAR
jgi:hypothetical protein